MIPKNLRHEDPDLLAKVRTQPCAACGNKSVDAAHIKSRGSGGDDTYNNVIALCRMHHSEQHQIGWKKFCDKYVSVKWLVHKNGWSFGPGGKLVR